jgi:hypothetical protein
MAMRHFGPKLNRRGSFSCEPDQNGKPAERESKVWPHGSVDESTRRPVNLENALY